MKRKLPPFHDLIKTIDIRLLMIRMDNLNNNIYSWTIGLTDKVGDPSLNYFQCETETKAIELIDSILSRYDDLSRGENFGIEPNRVIVYISSSI